MSEGLEDPASVSRAGRRPEAVPDTAEQFVSDRKDFTNWYKSVLEYTQFLDDRYPLKGCYVWRPFGHQALRRFLDIVDGELRASGHEEVCFPLLSPESLFSRESDFLHGVQSESLRVTHYGAEPLGEDLIVRPTSETIMYPMFALWIRSHADLPLRVYQTVPVFRWETKMTVPMLRNREVNKFNEAHTAHSSRGDMERQITEAVRTYRRIFDRLLLPYRIFLTPPWDTFPGAEYNFDFIGVLPNGKAVELGSVIALGTKFSGVYDIGFTTPDGRRELVWQTCYGLSERALGTAVAVHGDEAGLRLPAELAPWQVVIVPIPTRATAERVHAYAEGLARDLAAEVRVHLDGRDLAPGRKFYHWEAHGVPLRLEIGGREVNADGVTIAVRYNRRRVEVSRAELPATIRRLLAESDAALREGAKEEFQRWFVDLEDEETARSRLADQGGIVLLPWDGTVASGREMAERVGGTALGVPVADPERPLETRDLLGKTSRRLAFARTV